jgi:Secretion system C-terminal sorting domain
LRHTCCFFFLLLLCPLGVFAQFVLSPIPSQNASSSARTKDVTPKKLPFWDDFSFTKGSSPTDTLWADGKSVWLNNGIGINPPSLGVVTFDGLDAEGKPYNATDVLAKGFADNLVSRPLKLNLVDPAQRATVYISFFYQLKGRGESPDGGDFLRLAFLNKDKGWETVWSIENDNTQQPDAFYQVIIPVPTDNDRFFHEGFQFRFQNFARLSGAYDTWNLDYVYVNQGRSVGDISYPDRTLITPPGSLFKDYHAIPFKHFIKSPANLLNQASFSMFNLRIGNIQPVNYYTYVDVQNYKAGVFTTASAPLDNDESVGAVNELTVKSAQIKTLPATNLFDPLSDSIRLNFKLALSTKDNVAPVDNGDYDAAKYSPIDFRWNDTIRTTHVLSDFYAYDDGSAEYGAGVKGYGVQVMYRFDMTTAESDTIVGIKMYFPRFGDEASQLIQLQVFKDLSESSSSVLYRETVPIQRSQNNKFIYFKFNRFVPVQGSFYIGWKQNTSYAISIGLDKNTDSSNKIYFNTAGTWEQDLNTKGSLMMRPVFGKGGLVTAIDEPEPGEIITEAIPYPNPNKGTFFLCEQAERVKVIDMTGKEIYFTSETTGDQQRIELNSALPGLYVVHYLLNNRMRTHKIIVRQ